MQPKYDLDKIKFATDGPTFEKAVDLYEKGKITRFKEGIGGYSAIVLGSKPYQVSVEVRRYDYGHCECYLGGQDILCKHMVAVAIQAVTRGLPLDIKDKQLATGPVCSGKLGEFSKKELFSVKGTIINALRYIKRYVGPSKTWFAYQTSLSEGANRLSAVISELPVSRQTAEILIDLLLRLDKKVCNGGVDDSDGTVGTFMEETVMVLQDYA